MTAVILGNFLQPRTIYLKNKKMIGAALQSLLFNVQKVAVILYNSAEKMRVCSAVLRKYRKKNEYYGVGNKYTKKDELRFSS